MLTIKRHGVRLRANGLTAVQNRIADADAAPVLVIGAPTGAGKTYGFQRLIARTGAVVLFIVPTQALARDICGSLEAEGLYAKLWDGSQTEQAKLRGESTWTDRLTSLKFEAGKRGGMIVATLEAFHGISLGYPDRARVNLRVRNVLDHVDFLVFDEAHLLNERAFGFVAMWAALIAYRWNNAGGRTRMALLSATHSKLVEFLVGRTPGATMGLPPDWVEYCEESVEEVATGDDVDGLRIIHGDVDVELSQDEIEQVAADRLPGLLDRHRRVLMIHDSVARLGLHEARLSKIIEAAGLTREDVFVFSGQDKYLERSAGSAGFPAGRNIPSHSRLIVGTSAIEVGLNLAGATALITDPGLNAGALLQRIGRVSRGDQRGEVFVVYRKKTPFIIKLNELSGRRSIREVCEQMAPLIDFREKMAWYLAGAYLSMVRRRNRQVIKGLDQVLTAIEEDAGRRPCLYAHN